MNLLSSLYSKFNKSGSGKIGLSLSGGGVRGIAHLGVLKALNEKDIYPDVIAGVSAGALAGVFYADGYKPDEIFKVFNQTSIFKFATFTVPKQGFVSMEKVIKILKEHIKAKSFDELKIPLYIAASNLNDGIVEYFHEGSIIDKVVASASIPVLFKPHKINDKIFVDGGLFDNLPVEPIRKKCKILIGSNVTPLSEENDLDSFINIAERSFHLAIGKSVNENKKKCDFLIEPKDLAKYSLLKLEKAQEIFDIGYESALAFLESNKVK